MEFIKDGTGGGHSAAVTVNNRLKTTGLDLTLTEAATESGDTYNINSDETTLSTTGESALFYIENREDTNLIITSIVLNIMDYAGTDGQPILKIYRNPTAGTIVTDETAANQQNRNYGSSKTLVANCYQGGEGKTLSGQDNSVTVYLPSTAAVTLLDFSTITVLPKGASLGISYTPPAGVTSLKIIAAINTTLNGTQL